MSERARGFPSSLCCLFPDRGDAKQISGVSFPGEPLLVPLAGGQDLGKGHLPQVPAGRQGCLLRVFHCGIRTGARNSGILKGRESEREGWRERLKGESAVGAPKGSPGQLPTEASEPEALTKITQLQRETSE